MSEWKVPGYTELKPLGAGGFGSVVLARHDATGTAVAIKYLLPKLREDPDFAALFRAEAEALGALDDPYVVRLYEYVESAAGAAIVMELIDGVTLWDILSQHGQTTPQSALVVLYGSLLGLAAAHARGVVHRDFKPRNVLVNAQGASKLTDFGIAARTGASTIPSGSVAYAPPEQFDGGPASPASDVYAATATFYECLAGRPPFTGTTMEAVIWQHHSASVPMDPVPEPLRPIVARGMAKDPGYRPSDAAALAAELRAAAAGAYGPDWEQHGRWHLGEAAVLLAALWPSAGVPALHVTSTELVHLSHGTQHAHGVQAAHQPTAKAGLHRWHLRHVLHLRHVAATVATAAVVAAGVTVAVTSRAPDGPGTPAHPAVAAYQAPLAPPIPATLTSGVKPVNGNTYVLYGPNTAVNAFAKLSGEISDATAGEVVRLYAQQFPYTSAPAPVQSLTLNPVGGTAAYSFTVSPSLATRYQLRLLPSAAATTPAATSAVNTVYVLDSYSVTRPDCPGGGTCDEQLDVTVYSPPSAIATEMAKRTYLYAGRTESFANQSAATLPLNAGGTASAPRRTAANAYDMTLTYDGVGLITDRVFCMKQNEAQDGIGLPGPSACGSASMPLADAYAIGY